MPAPLTLLGWALLPCVLTHRSAPGRLRYSPSSFSSPAHAPQVKELLELAGLGRAFEILTLARQYGGAGVNNVSDMRKLFLTDDNNVWCFKLQLSPGEETTLKHVMSNWQALSCMPQWMRPAELSLGLALANALDNQLLGRTGELNINVVPHSAVGEGGGLAVARFVAEVHGLWAQDQPRSPSPTPGAPPPPPHGLVGPNLTSLNLSGCRVGSKSAMRILESLCLGVPLISLDLARNGVDHQTVPTLVKVLRTVTTLEKLVLNGERRWGDTV